VNSLLRSTLGGRGVDCEAAPTPTSTGEPSRVRARMERRRSLNQAFLAAPTASNTLSAARRHHWCYPTADSFLTRLSGVGSTQVMSELGLMKIGFFELRRRSKPQISGFLGLTVVGGENRRKKGHILAI